MRPYKTSTARTMTNSSAFKLGALLILLLTIQTSWLARFTLWGVHPDFALLLTVSVALLFGWRAGGVFGLCAGFMGGVLAAKNIGSFLLSRTLCGAVVGLSDRGFARDNIFAPPLLAALGTLFSDFIVLLMSPTDFPLSWWLFHTPVKMLLHAILIWPLHFVVMKMCAPPARSMFSS